MRRVGLYGALLHLSLITAAITVSVSSAVALQYVGVDLGALGGTNSSIARAINDIGQIVGSSGGPSTPVIWEKGTIEALPILPDTGNNVPYGINNEGLIVGATTSYSRAVLWHNGVATLLPNPTGAYYSWAYAINNTGQIVGYSRYSEPSISGDRATLRDNGIASDLGVLPDHNRSSAIKINDNGIAVGSSSLHCGHVGTVSTRCVVWKSSGIEEPAGTSTAESAGVAINDHDVVLGWLINTDGQWTIALWTNGVPNGLGPFPVGCRPIDINNEGQVLISRGSNHPYHPMVWQNNHTYDLLSPLGGSANATAINNLGQVVGYDMSHHRAVLWLPVNEASIGSARVLNPALPFSGVSVEDAIVTAVGLEPGTVFVQSRDRSSGIKLITNQELSIGMGVSFIGMCSRVDGEYQISDVRFEENITDETPLSPVLVSSRMIGNDTFQNLNYNGMNTTGLLVKMVGKVTSTMSALNVLYIDDGGKYEDGIGPSSGIRVSVPVGVPLPVKGKMVAITGISRVEKRVLARESSVNGKLYPAGTILYVPSIWVRGSSDIQVFAP